MAYVVTQDCIMCKHTDCVEVCPVDCFYEGPNFIVINAEECIDCSLCEPVCPEEAIKAEGALSEDEQIFVELNSELAEIWPNLDEVKSSLPEAKKFSGVENKLSLLER